MRGRLCADFCEALYELIQEGADCLGQLVLTDIVGRAGVQVLYSRRGCGGIMSLFLP